MKFSMRIGHSLVYIIVYVACVLALVWAMRDIAHSMTWSFGVEHTVQWEPVTLLEDGTSPDPDSVIMYRVYLRRTNNQEEPALVVDMYADTQYTLTLVGDGKWFVGVQALRYDTVDQLVIGESTISWSDNPLVCQGGVDFGVRIHTKPDHPRDLR